MEHPFGHTAVSLLERMVACGWKIEAEGDLFYRCFFCGARHETEVGLEHDPDCPYDWSQAFLKSLNAPATDD